MRGHGTLLLIWLSVLSLWTGANAETLDFDQRLEEAIAQTNQELQAERTRMQAEQRARQAELTRIRNEKQDLARALVTGKLTVARKQAALAALRQQRETQWGATVQWQQDLEEITLLCQEVVQTLTELTDHLPPSEARPRQVATLDRLQVALAQAQWATVIQAACALWQSMLSESRTTAVYPAAVVDPQGRTRQAQVLRVGQSVFAYLHADSAQTAMALSAPYEQAGFRWTELTSATTRDRVNTAITQASDIARVYALPLDVTGRLSTHADLSQTNLYERMRAGGIVMIPLALVALWLGVLILERWIVLSGESRHSLGFCERVVTLCRQGAYDEAAQVVGTRKGMVSRTLQVCLTHRHCEAGALADGIQETLLHEFPKLERFFPSIKMLASVAPMLGLLGTVTGIIATFDIITLVGSGKPRLMAGGISEALVTTATGLIIAIPGLLAHSWLSGKVDRLMADTERFAATLVNLIQQQRGRPGTAEQESRP